MKDLVALSILVAGIAIILSPSPAVAARPPNIIILMSDDQRWDKVTPQYMPNVWALGHGADATRLGSHRGAEGVAYRNSFVPNPMCCPSRASTLTGNYSQTTGVWKNAPPFGGWETFHGGPEAHTIATDLDAAGYRTALIGKYLNGYRGGRTSFVPPGWDRWFATPTAAFYKYGVTTKSGFRHYGSRHSDYITRVLNHQAQRFVAKGTAPFFLYYSFTAPHSPAIPDPRDVGRFAGERDLGFRHQTNRPSSQLESAYSMDRAVGQILRNVPDNTIVVYIGDNGYLWGEKRLAPSGGDLVTKHVRAKEWPYNESIRVPIIFATLDDTTVPLTDREDIVLNVDLRESLLTAVGIKSNHEGLNWFDPGYVARDSFVLEHTGTRVPTYCGARSKGFMYARFSGGQELFFDETIGEKPVDLLERSEAPADYHALKALARTCQPPDGYTWGA